MTCSDIGWSSYNVTDDQSIFCARLAVSTSILTLSRLMRCRMVGLP